MVGRGVYVAPSPYEAGFLSLAHTEAMLDEVVAKMREAVRMANT
jgi:glutamate-1-semialdehyde 2,1-aminomutase